MKLYVGSEDSGQGQDSHRESHAESGYSLVFKASSRGGTMGLICLGSCTLERFQDPKNPGPGPGLISEGKAFQNRPPAPPAIPCTRPIVLENNATLAAMAALTAAWYMPSQQAAHAGPAGLCVALCGFHGGLVIR